MSTVLLALLLTSPPASASDSLERIDDRTAIDLATGRRVDLAPAATASSTSPATNGTLAAGDGFVGCSFSDDGFPFDPVTRIPGTSTALLPRGDYPYDATMTPDGREIWIPGASGDGVVVVDRVTGTAALDMAVGQYMISVAFSADGRLAFASSRDDQALYVIDALVYRVLFSTPTPQDLGNLARDPTTGLIYGVHWYGASIYEFAADGSSLLRSAPVGTNLWQLVVSPDGCLIYVTERSSSLNLVRVLDRATLTEVATIPVGDDPWGLDITADGNHLVVTLEDDGIVQIIDTRTRVPVTVTLDAGADPRDVDILDASGLAFVTGGQVGVSPSVRSPVYVIDIATATLLGSFDAPGSNTNVIAVATLPAGLPPVCCAVLPAVAAVTAIKRPTAADVRLAWPGIATSTGGYDVWRVEAKLDIAIARNPPTPGVTPICVPTAAASCDDTSTTSLPATWFYQVRALCGGNEGP